MGLWGFGEALSGTMIPSGGGVCVGCIWISLLGSEFGVLPYLRPFNIGKEDFCLRLGVWAQALP